MQNSSCAEVLEAVRPPQGLAGALLIASLVTGRGDDPPVSGIELRIRGRKTHRAKRERLGFRMPALPIPDHREPVPDPRVARLDLEGALQGRRRTAVLPGLSRRTCAVEEGDDGGILLRWRPAIRAEGDLRAVSSFIGTGRRDFRGP